MHKFYLYSEEGELAGFDNKEEFISAYINKLNKEVNLDNMNDNNLEPIIC